MKQLFNNLNDWLAAKDYVSTGTISDLFKLPIIQAFRTLSFIGCILLGITILCLIFNIV